MSAPDRLSPLRTYLQSAYKIASRLAASVDRVAPLFPLDAERVVRLTADEEEQLDAFLLRFASLAAAVQDHVGRALLLAEEESLAEASRKDQRLMLEKLGALKPELGFDAIAKLRNRLVQSYPDDPERHADVLNEAYAKSPDLLWGLDGLIAYVMLKFGFDLGLPRIRGRA